MKEGYWINYKSGKMFPVDEHEIFIRQPGMAKKMGVPNGVIGLFKNFTPIQDRDKFLLFVMANSPLMRMRGHGSFVTFEYSTRSRQEPLESILTVGQKEFGPFTSMLIRNFATNENVEMSFGEFEQNMDSGGAEAIMRVAKKVSVKRKIAMELLALSKQLLK